MIESCMEIWMTSARVTLMPRLGRVGALCVEALSRAGDCSRLGVDLPVAQDQGLRVRRTRRGDQAHPGARFRRDLAVLRSIAPIVRRLVPISKLDRVLDQLSAMLARETDYAQE